MKESPSILEVRNLQVMRGDIRVLDVPELALKKGEVLALIGPNGAGKSTLMLSLACLLDAADGMVSLGGIPLRSRQDKEAYRKRVTVVFQEPMLFDMTVHRNIAAGLKFRGINKEERERRIARAAQRFGITHLLPRSARMLSGGEAQRVSLARAFVLDPEIIYLDEPFSALDPPTREALLDDLAAVLKETGTSAVMATHDQADAVRLADRLAVMNAGRIAQLGSTAEVINHPTDEFVADFVGMETVMEGEVISSESGTFTLTIGPQHVEAVGVAQVGQLVLVGVRPENVTLASHESGDTSARNIFYGNVTRIVPKGPFFRVELDCGFFLSAFVTARSMEELHLKEGSPVVASFKATAVHVIRKQAPER